MTRLLFLIGCVGPPLLLLWALMLEQFFSPKEMLSVPTKIMKWLRCFLPGEKRDWGELPGDFIPVFESWSYRDGEKVGVGSTKREAVIDAACSGESLQVQEERRLRQRAYDALPEYHKEDARKSVFYLKPAAEGSGFSEAARISFDIDVGEDDEPFIPVW